MPINPTFSELPKQPQSAGDLVGRGLRLYRQNALLIAQVLLYPTVGTTIGKICLQFGLIHLKDLSYFLTAVALTVVGVCLHLWFLWVLSLRQLALVRLLNGFDKDFSSAYRSVKKNPLRMLVAYLLAFVAIAVFVGGCTGELIASAIALNSGALSETASICLIVLGFLSLFAASFAVNLILFFQLAVVALWNVAAGGWLKESFSLIWNNFWRSYSFAMILTITLAFLAMPLSLPIFCVSAFDAVRNGPHSTLDPSKITLFSLIFVQIWESVINMVVWPVMFLAYGCLYRDLKMRRQAIDVVQSLDELQYSGA